MRFYRLLSRFAAIILLITAVLKLCESTQHNFYFQEPDSVMQFLTNRQLLFVAAGLEIIVAIYIWFTASLKKRSFALLWFCSIVALYKIGRYYTRAFYPCSCLGILESWLKLTWNQTDTISWLTLAFLAAFSIACLFHEKCKPQTRP